MAENEKDDALDDFFAKKDKSKKKSKSKTSGDLLSGDGPKKLKKKSKAEKLQAKEEVKDKEEDEWKDLAEEEVDYSDLKIQSMSIRQEQQEAEEAREKEEKLEADTRENRDGGPWNAAGSAEAPTCAPEPVKATASSSSYVPPAMRSGGAAVTGAARKKKKEAPNIQSEMDFPTLGGASPAVAGVWTKQQTEGFEEVRTGHQTRINSGSTRSLQVGNRYDALSSEQ